MKTMKRSGVSNIIAELLLIAMTVAIGTLVYSFASTAFSSFGSGFTGLVSSSGDTLSEHIVVEQVYLFTNSTGGDIYVRNVGPNTATIMQIFVANVTAATGVPLCSSTTPPPCASVQWPADFPTAPITIKPDSFVQIKVVYTPDSGSTYAFTLVTALGNEVTAYEKA